MFEKNESELGLKGGFGAGDETIINLSEPL